MKLKQHMKLKKIILAIHCLECEQNMLCVMSTDTSGQVWTLGSYLLALLSFHQPCRNHK